MATAKKTPAKKTPAKKTPAVAATPPRRGSSTPSVQYRVVVSKADERVVGADDAEVVFVCAIADAGLDPTVAYMQGKLKATGNSGQILEQLWSGEAQRVISQLALLP